MAGFIRDQIAPMISNFELLLRDVIGFLFRSLDVLRIVFFLGY